MIGNHVTFIGRLTHDIEVRDANGTSIINFTLARNRRVKQGDEPISDFVNFVAFNKTAELIAKYHHKGDLVAIDGHIQVGEYESKKFKDDNGNAAKMRRVDVIVDSIDFVGGRSSSGNSGQNNQENHRDEPAKPVEHDSDETTDDNDLPF